MRERLEVVFYGVTLWTDLREKIVKAVGVNPTSTTSTGPPNNKHTLEFDLINIHLTLAAVRRECPECQARIIYPPNYGNTTYGGGGGAYGGGYGPAAPYQSTNYVPPPPKPKVFLKVWADSGEWWWVTCPMNEDDPQKEVLWVRDNGVHITGTTRKVQPDEIARIKIYTEAQRTAEEAETKDKVADQKTIEPSGVPSPPPPPPPPFDVPPSTPLLLPGPVASTTNTTDAELDALLKDLAADLADPPTETPTDPPLKVLPDLDAILDEMG